MYNTPIAEKDTSDDDYEPLIGPSPIRSVEKIQQLRETIELVKKNVTLDETST